jgi:hypothetical protein
MAKKIIDGGCGWLMYRGMAKTTRLACVTKNNKYFFADRVSALRLMYRDGKKISMANVGV